jgi:hypothetical protein
MRAVDTQGSAYALPTTGHSLPRYDAAGTEREARAERILSTIFIPYPRQTAIMERIEALRCATLGKRGVPLPGLRLSQVSQAGKSKTLERYIEELHTRMQVEGQPANPHRVLYIGLKRRVTVKMLYQHILMKLGDPHASHGNVEILSQRAEEFVRKFGVELLIVDEVQHLGNTRKDSSDVADELKTFMDSGLVPVVFSGNEKSRAFFEENNQLTVRLGIPLELSPISAKSDVALFKAFCLRLDEAIAQAGATRGPSNFKDGKILSGLLAASNGHIGRVCRIVQAALAHAARRDADFIEVHDLSFAITNLAIPAAWTVKNPFPEVGA